ncbi:prepilin peptidase [Candidatus Gottesmanbacteria bacterium]|nr:prepilin peptidase [Candidatus Gottesmanbacteria bacterium]
MQSFFAFFLGMSVGSFLNVLIDRLPKGESVLVGRSHCDWCKKNLRWDELIPLFSWIIQAGRCRRCHKRLSIQYPLIELTSGILFIIGFQQTQIIPFLFVSCSLLVIFVADLKYQIIPDSMVVVGVLGALIGFIGQIRPIGLLPYLASAAGAAGFFLLLWLVTRGRGMGFGDVKLAFFLGLLLGFPGIVIALYAAFLTGALVGVILILLRKKTIKGSVAFGPFLIIGAIVATLWTDQIRHFWVAVLPLLSF